MWTRHQGKTNHFCIFHNWSRLKSYEASILKDKPRTETLGIGSTWSDARPICTGLKPSWPGSILQALVKRNPSGVSANRRANTRQLHLLSDYSRLCTRFWSTVRRLFEAQEIWYLQCYPNAPTIGHSHKLWQCFRCILRTQALQLTQSPGSSWNILGHHLHSLGPASLRSTSWAQSHMPSSQGSHWLGTL